MLIRDIFPLDNEDDIWILCKGFREKQFAHDEEETDEENLAHLANLGMF